MWMRACGAARPFDEGNVLQLAFKGLTQADQKLEPIHKEIGMAMMRFVFVMVWGAVVLAQEGPATLPHNYSVQFENAWVKVTSVRYDALQKLPAHTHTPNPSAYLYLNDGPPVIFKHVGGKGMAATRAATKAGAFRVYRGLMEIHEVENTGNEPSEFLRVELKTEPIEPASFVGKFERPATPSAEPVVHFNHPQVAVSRVWILPNQTIEIAADSQPVLVVALSAGAELGRGGSKWVDVSSKTRLRNGSTSPIDLLRFDFKTKPQQAR